MNTIRLLHVEDDRVQQAVMSHRLKTMRDYRFEVCYATSEDEAISVFPSGGFNLVFLDYHLQQGNGLSCLNRIRNMDSLIPIISISGVASDEIAAELITAGADDYLAKQTLNGHILGQSVRHVLSRAQAFKSRFAVNTKLAPIKNDDLADIN